MHSVLCVLGADDVRSCTSDMCRGGSGHCGAWGLGSLGGSSLRKRIGKDSVHKSLLRSLKSIQGGLKKTPELIYRKTCMCSYTFRLHSPSKRSLQPTHQDAFPPLRTAFERIDFGAF